MSHIQHQVSFCRAGSEISAGWSYRGTISKDIFTLEVGKDLVQVRSTADRFAPPWPFKGTSFQLCSLGWGLCQAVAGWLE